MTADDPKPHHNPDTFLDEPVYLFTDQAIVRPKRPPSEKPAAPPEGKPSEQPPASEGSPEQT